MFLWNYKLFDSRIPRCDALKCLDPPDPNFKEKNWACLKAKYNLSTFELYEISFNRKQEIGFLKNLKVLASIKDHLGSKGEASDQDMLKPIHIRLLEQGPL